MAAAGRVVAAGGGEEMDVQDHGECKGEKETPIPGKISKENIITNMKTVHLLKEL